jgi:sirohydrochlorin ferrochelatase
MSNETGLILFSHGSLIDGAEKALYEHCARLHLMGEFHCVEPGYLNYNEPAFPAAVQACVSHGAHHIVIVPYFLVPGRFVTVDIPDAVAAVGEQFPGVRFSVAEPIGYDPSLVQAILGLVNSASLIGPDEQGTTAALALLAHGSPCSDANSDIYRVIDDLRSSGSFSMVEVGYLECNSPTIPEAIEGCVSSGATRVIGVPYFLHAGNHVSRDLPAELEPAKKKFPNVEFYLTDYIGRSPIITGLLAARAREAVYRGTVQGL